MAKAMRIRKDDTVVVTGGKDRGKTGRVLRTDPQKRRVYVEGLNIVKRHQRPRSVKDTQKGAQTGGIIEKEGPIHVSNVMLLDPTDNKPTRVGVRATQVGKRERYAKRTGKAIESEGSDGSDHHRSPARGPAAAAARAFRERGGRAAHGQVRLRQSAWRSRASRR